MNPPDSTQPHPLPPLLFLLGGASVMRDLRARDPRTAAFSACYAPTKKDSKNEEKSILSSVRKSLLVSSSLLCVTLSDTPPSSNVCFVIDNLFFSCSPSDVSVFPSLFRFSVLVPPPWFTFYPFIWNGGIWFGFGGEGGFGKHGPFSFCHWFFIILCRMFSMLCDLCLPPIFLIFGFIPCMQTSVLAIYG
jgi:hypothetical protein